MPNKTRQNKQDDVIQNYSQLQKTVSRSVTLQFKPLIPVSHNFSLGLGMGTFHM